MMASMETKQQTQTDLIFHGHFYQPPRENPLVDIIPKQSSAKPFSDWNELIFDDCYRTNAHSRYLDAFGHVSDIVNNYEYISFNFGPTLLTWINRHHPEIHQKIIEADRLSAKRLGHGNAIAQAYNHTILPLAAKSDAWTQIQWGIDDFQRRFDRDPEGLWLPETAVNPAVVGLLAQAGLGFVILSPWQCQAIQSPDGEWIETNGNTVPYDEPFDIEGTDGNTITAFFYHPDLASGISFGHLLRDADALYRTLVEIVERDRPQLIHTATDGEIYGHHEPFGDMALAALIRKVRTRGEFKLTNYATFLQQHPATRKARLHAGEDKRGTSWSCPHGVSRWYKDCGCHTGGESGWNQSWRTPLRNAFEDLGGKIDAMYTREIDRLFDHHVDPAALLNSYAAVIGDFVDTKSFITGWETRAGTGRVDRRAVAELLEGQRFKHYMFTSCGWFFSDLAGIEPRQNIGYALRAQELYRQFADDDLLGPLLSLLQMAKSNKRHEGTGQTIARSMVNEIGGEAEAGAYFLMNRNFARPDDMVASYGKYRLISFAQKGKDRFTMELLDTKTLRRDKLACEVSVPPGDGYVLRMEIVDFNSTFNHEFTTAQIPPRMLDEVFTWIDHSLSRISDEELQRIASDIRHYSLVIKNGRSAPSETLYIENMGTCLRALRSLFTTPDTLPWVDKRESISYLLAFIKKKGRHQEQEIVRQIFSHEIDRVSHSIMDTGFTYEMGSYLLDLLNVARTQEIQPSITLAQEALYSYVIGDLRTRFETPLTAAVLDQLRTELNFS